jgi:RsiW-degrading membrane proteinase PrsW (M82 family)
LIFAALASMGLSFVVELPFLSSVGIAVTSAVFAPLLEEPLKALGILVAVFFVWKTIPNRRYGAALGAAAGLGFGISESILYIVFTPTVGMVLTRIVVTFMHPVWSAFVGMGIFAIGLGKVGQASSPNRSEFLMLLLFSLGVANHMVWNSLSIAFSLAGIGLIGLALDIFLIFPLSLIVLRDLLGGHFNFQNFFEPLETSTLTSVEIPPPPPPPPP